MSKIIKLEDGQLVAEDPDNGERVPVSFEALEADSATIGSSNQVADLQLTQLETGSKFVFGSDGTLRLKRLSLDERVRYVAGDSELNDALSDGIEVILLGGPETYLEDRVFDNNETIIGVGVGLNPRVDAEWTFTETNVGLYRLGRTDEDAKIIIEGDRFTLDGIRNCSSGTEIVVDADEVLITGLVGGGDVTFESGTSEGLIDSCAGGTIVTDNGNNTKGNIG